MINEELLQYVRSQIAKGLPREIIATNLMRGGGWNWYDVEEVFRALKSTSPAPEAQPPSTSPSASPDVQPQPVIQTESPAQFVPEQITAEAPSLQAAISPELQEVIREDSDTISKTAAPAPESAPFPQPAATDVVLSPVNDSLEKFSSQPAQDGAIIMPTSGGNVTSPYPAQVQAHFGWKKITIIIIVLVVLIGALLTAGYFYFNRSNSVQTPLTDTTQGPFSAVATTTPVPSVNAPVSPQTNATTSQPTVSTSTPSSVSATSTAQTVTELQANSGIRTGLSNTTDYMAVYYAQNQGYGALASHGNCSLAGSGFGDSLVQSGLQETINAALSSGGKNTKAVCWNTSTDWAISFPLVVAEGGKAYWCVDNTGDSKAIPNPITGPTCP